MTDMNDKTGCGWLASTALGSVLLLASGGMVQAQTTNAVAGTQPAANGSITLDTIVIDGSAEGVNGIIESDGYVAKSGRTATKTDTPVAQAPVSLSTVTQKQLQDIKPQNLVEALNYTPGVRGGLFGAEPEIRCFQDLRHGSDLYGCISRWFAPDQQSQWAVPARTLWFGGDHDLEGAGSFNLWSEQFGRDRGCCFETTDRRKTPRGRDPIWFLWPGAGCL